MLHVQTCNPAWEARHFSRMFPLDNFPQTCSTRRISPTHSPTGQFALGLSSRSVLSPSLCLSHPIFTTHGLLVVFVVRGIVSKNTEIVNMCGLSVMCSRVLPTIEISEMSVTQSVECPLTVKDTAIVSGSLSTRNGNGVGTISLALRRVLSHTAWAEVIQTVRLLMFLRVTAAVENSSGNWQTVEGHTKWHFIFIANGDTDSSVTVK